MTLIRQFLNLHTLRVRLKRGKFIDFTEVPNHAKGKDIYEIIEEFVTYLESKDHDDKETYSITSVEDKVAQPKRREIYGSITNGNYGLNGKLVNSATGKKKQIGRVEAPVYKYYFFFLLPTTGNRGIFAIHSRGNDGSKTSFSKALYRFMLKNYPNISISLSPVMIDFRKDYKKFYKRFFVRKLKAVTFRVKRNEDYLTGGGSIGEEEITIERSMKVNRTIRGLFPFNAFAGAADPTKMAKKKFSDYLEIKDIDENTEYRITVEMDGQEKSMVLGETLSFKMSFDLSSDLESDPEIFNRKDPSFSKLHAVCKGYIEHARKHVIGEQS